MTGKLFSCCPFCHARRQVRTDEGVTYTCGTWATYNRGVYRRRCN